MDAKSRIGCEHVAAMDPEERRQRRDEARRRLAEQRESPRQSGCSSLLPFWRSAATAFLGGGGAGGDEDEARAEKRRQSSRAAAARSCRATASWPSTARRRTTSSGFSALARRGRPAAGSSGRRGHTTAGQARAAGLRADLDDRLERPRPRQRLGRPPAARTIERYLKAARSAEGPADPGHPARTGQVHGRGQGIAPLPGGAGRLAGPRPRVEHGGGGGPGPDDRLHGRGHCQPGLATTWRASSAAAGCRRSCW